MESLNLAINAYEVPVLIPPIYIKSGSGVKAIVGVNIYVKANDWAIKDPSVGLKIITLWLGVAVCIRSPKRDSEFWY